MKYLIPLLLLIVINFNFSACKKRDKQISEQQKSTYKGPPVKNDWYVLHLDANPEILNPVLSTDMYSSEVIPYIFDALITYNIYTAEPEGKLAESWKISADGLIYDFFLRKNILFHDGKPLTAEDVKFTFDAILNPKVDAPVARSYYENLKKIEVIGPYHIRFHMKTPYYRNLITLGNQEIIPKHIYEKGDFNKHPNNRKPIGSGPYVFEKWETGRAVELKRFEKWWGNSVPEWKDRNNFNKVLFRIISEAKVTVMAFKKGDIDAMEPTASQFTQDFADPRYEKEFYKLIYETEDGRGYGYVGWNLSRPLFQDKRVRRALAMAMPRDEINKKIFGGLRKPAVGPFPQISPKTDPSIKPIPYDLNQATALLAEAGWKDTDGDGVLDKNGKKFSFELKFTAGVPDNERVGLIYQQSLKQIGVEIDIKTLEWTVFLKQVKESKFDAIMMGWGSSLDSDPYQVWHSSQAIKGGSNHVGFRNKEVDQLLETARVTLDREKRKKLYQKFTSILADEAPYLFTFEHRHLFVTNRRFQNVLPVGKLGLDTSRWFVPPDIEKYKETVN